MTLTDHDALRHMTPQALGNFGLENLAYVKPVITEDGHQAFSIHAADGSEMAVVDDRDVAFAAVRQHDMEPVSVH